MKPEQLAGFTDQEIADALGRLGVMEPGLLVRLFVIPALTRLGPQWLRDHADQAGQAVANYVRSNADQLVQQAVSFLEQ